MMQCRKTPQDTKKEINLSPEELAKYNDLVFRNMTGTLARGFTKIKEGRTARERAALEQEAAGGKAGAENVGSPPTAYLVGKSNWLGGAPVVIEDDCVGRAVL